MRLSAEQVKQGIVHPERIVRDCALRYFSESISGDPTAMPLAIQAIEACGWVSLPNIRSALISQDLRFLPWNDVRRRMTAR